MQAVGLENFKKEVQDHSAPVIVDFYADWCAPCRALAPVLEKLASEGHKVVKVDIQANPELAVEYNVKSLPTLIAFMHGNPIVKIVGISSRTTVLNMLEAAKNHE